MAYLWGHFEPADEKEGKRMFQRARSYTLYEGELYKSGVVAPWLKCVTTAEGQELLKEIHSRLCGSHIGIRPLVAKAFRQGFFWPSALKDAEKIVKTCEGCQMMAPKSNRPSQPIQLIPPHGHSKHGAWTWSVHYQQLMATTNTLWLQWSTSQNG